VSNSPLIAPEALAERLGDAPPTDPIPESAEAIGADGDDDEETEADPEAEGAAA